MSTDFDYDGMPIDGIEVTVATPEVGKIVIPETDGFTVCRESGTPGADAPSQSAVDKYTIRLAAGSYQAAPLRDRLGGASPQEEINDDARSTWPAHERPGRHDLVVHGPDRNDADCDQLEPSTSAHDLRNGQLVSVDDREPSC